MTEQAIRDAVEKAKGRIFAVEFVTKKGESRKMLARTGVTKHLKGGELTYDPIEKGMLIVFDMQKQAYRTVNLNTVTSISLEVENEQVP